MNKNLKWLKNSIKDNTKAEQSISIMNKAVSEEVERFHKSFDEYSVTPLRDLEALASMLDVKKVFVKDESYRFGLNAFKVLGASYAIGKSLATRLNCSIDEVPFPVLKSKKVRDQLGNITFAATTDGNHGRGVAWTAKELGFDAVIYMPKGTTENRLNHILELGAHSEIKEMNYDDTVRWVAEQAKDKNWEIIQDTAWEGYEDVPKWIMQGYSTLGKEAIEQMGDTKPTHIFLQAGVGAFAAVMAAVLLQAYTENPPKIILVEASKADCFYQSISNQKVTPVTGDLSTIMAGLACGEPNPLAWTILSAHADTFISAPDWVTARGMRILGNPLGSDEKIISGESGAVGVGVLSLINDKNFEDLKQALEIDENSIILNFSTEGDTDAVSYRSIVWDGKYSSL